MGKWQSCECSKNEIRYRSHMQSTIIPWECARRSGCPSWSALFPASIVNYSRLSFLELHVRNWFCRKWRIPTLFTLPSYFSYRSKDGGDTGNLHPDRISYRTLVLLVRVVSNTRWGIPMIASLAPSHLSWPWRRISSEGRWVVAIVDEYFEHFLEHCCRKL